jgi:hypothetical protein
MTPAEFDALVSSVPSGLHDAELVSIAVDLAAATVTCLVNVDLSDPGDPASEGSSRPARLTFAGVSVVVVDPPACEVLSRLEPAWLVDVGSGDPATSPRPDLKAPDDGFLAWLYLESINGFIRIGGRSASIAWVDDPAPA